MMVVYSEEKEEEEAPGKGGTRGPEAEDSVGVDGVLVAKVGGYVATRFMPLADGCGGAVKSLAVAPGGERVTCVSETGPVALLQSGYHVDDGKFVPFSGGCHCAPVIAVDVCFGSFPLAVTAAADRTARLWHLEERRCMAVHLNDDDISSVCLHPSGTMVALGDENGGAGGPCQMSVVIATSWDTIYVKSRGFKLHVDDATGNICPPPTSSSLALHSFTFHLNLTACL